MLDLLFRQPPAVDGHLVFGEEDGQPSVVEATLAAVLPALALAALVRPAQPAQLAAALPSLALSGVAQYRSQTQRPTVRKTQSAWQDAARRVYGRTAHHQLGAPTPAGWQAAWQVAGYFSVWLGHPLPDRLRPTPAEMSARHQSGYPIRTAGIWSHQEAIRRKTAAEGSWQVGIPIRHGRLFRHQDGIYRHAVRRSQWQVAVPSQRTKQTGFSVAIFWPLSWRARYQDAIPPPPGKWTPPPPPPPPPCYQKSPHLLFSASLGSPTLLLRCDLDDETGGGGGSGEGVIIVPILGVYLMVNAVSLRRALDDRPIPAYRVSLSLDADSWSWGWSAELPLSSEPLVMDDEPVEVIIGLNAATIHVLAEEISRERTFAQGRVRVSGRGINAVLGEPYAPKQSFTNTAARTARQLMDDVLTINGVPLGWTLDFRLTDWLVPAGVFAFQGTYIDAILDIAQAAGGYVQPDMSAKTLHILPRYPIPPWQWASATPDIALPSAVVQRESLKWLDKPIYNRVFVSGRTQGVLGQVTRAGTAGDKLAPMQVHDLITHADAARQKGLAILGDTGRQAYITLRLPLLEATGIILPGKLITYTDTTPVKGLSRSVSVEADMVEVWQTISLEVHT